MFLKICIMISRLLLTFPEEVKYCNFLSRYRAFNMDGRGFNKGNIFINCMSSVQVLPNIFKEIAKVGFPIHLTGVVSFISGQGDRVVTAFHLGSYYLGIYQLVALAAVVPSMLISSFSSSLLPSSTYYYAKGKDMKEISSISFRIVTLISLPMAILGYTISPFSFRSSYHSTYRVFLQCSC